MTSKISTFKALAFLLLFSGALLTSCGDAQQPEDNDQTENNSGTTTEETAAPDAGNDGKGVGPITSVEICAGIDKNMADKGKAVFESKCTACHNTDATKKVGPGLAGVTERRKPEWIMNMVLNPEKMVQEDPTAK